LIDRCTRPCIRKRCIHTPTRASALAFCSRLPCRCTYTLVFASGLHVSWLVIGILAAVRWCTWWQSIIVQIKSEQESVQLQLKKPGSRWLEPGRSRRISLLCTRSSTVCNSVIITDERCSAWTRVPNTLNWSIPTLVIGRWIHRPAVKLQLVDGFWENLFLELLVIRYLGIGYFTTEYFLVGSWLSAPELFFQEYWHCSWSWYSKVQTSGVKSLVFGNWNYQNTLIVLTLTFPNIYWAVISASKHAVVNAAVTVCIFR